MKTIKIILAILLVAFLGTSCKKETIVNAKPEQPQRSISISVVGISAAVIDSVKIDNVVYSSGFPLITGGVVLIPTSATATLSTVTLYVRKVSGQLITFTDAEGIARSSVYGTDYSNPTLITSFAMNIGFGTQSASVVIGTKAPIY